MAHFPTVERLTYQPSCTDVRHNDKRYVLRPPLHGVAGKLFRAVGVADAGSRRASHLRDGVYVDSLLLGRLIAPRPTAGAPGEAVAASGFAAESSGPGEGA